MRKNRKQASMMCPKLVIIIIFNFQYISYFDSYASAQAKALALAQAQVQAPLTTFFYHNLCKLWLWPINTNTFQYDVYHSENKQFIFSATHRSLPIATFFFVSIFKLNFPMWSVVVSLWWFCIQFLADE